MRHRREREEVRDTDGEQREADRREIERAKEDNKGSDREGEADREKGMNTARERETNAVGCETQITTACTNRPEILV